MDLGELELELEMNSLKSGIKRDLVEAELLEKRGEVAQWTPYQRLIKGGLGMVSGVLRSALEDTSGPHVTMLRHLDPDLLAYAGLWGAVNGIAQGKDVRGVTLLIAGLLEDQLWTEALEAQDPKQFARVWRHVRVQQNAPRNRKKALRPLAEKVELEWVRWTRDLSMRVGAFVLNGVLRAGLCVLRKGEEGVEFLDLSSDARAAFDDVRQEASWLRPVNMPMVVAPKPWRGVTDGGYTTRRMQELNPLVRGLRGAHRTLLEDTIASNKLNTMFTSINAIQATPWRVNGALLDIVTQAFERGMEIEGFPRSEALALPEPPAGNWEALAIKEQKRLRRERDKVRKRNTTIDGQKVTLNTDLKTARTLVDLDQFWIPHNVDFRGRVYPLCQFNQQRGDYVRSMLEFAEGKELTPEGLRWLMIHVANCGDFEKVSKKSFDDRVKWCEENSSRIGSIVLYPFQDLWWTCADKPFQFLRACIELVNYWSTEGHGVPFVSHLPIDIDGSNSGLQHYSALLRSEHDGKFVNLIPQEVPADIYAEVARRVEAAAKLSEEPEAKLWLDFGITRKIVKRNVMTFPYSSSTFGFREQIMSDIMLPLEDEVVDGKRPSHPFGEDGGWKAAGWLAVHVYRAVTATVASASGAMTWLKKVAGALASEGKGLVYDSPVGFPVHHAYTEYTSKRVELFLFDREMDVVDANAKDVVKDEGVYRRIRSTIRVAPTRTLVKSRQRSAVSPNVIHSMDGAHLMLTALAAFNQGVTSFSLVHDSFGCHASNMPTLFRVVREQMVGMYSKYDPITEIHSRACAELSAKGQKKIAKLPERGSLDLHLILDSQFAFA